MIVAELRQTFPLRILLKISRLPRSTFYYHLKASCTDKHRADKQAIMEVFERNDSRYGYRRITLELHKNGIIINHKTVLKLMKSLSIRGKQCKNGQNSPQM